jgi:hypothetical protein
MRSTEVEQPIGQERDMKTETNDRPVVRSFEPSAGFRRMTRLGNAFVRPLLRSHVGARIHELALLRFEGRRSGKHYEVPVEYHELEGEPLILTASGWKRNLRGGADVELVHDGRTIPMRAELIEDADEVARIYERLLRQLGVGGMKATKIGLQVKVDRIPTRAEIATAVDGKRAVVRLRPR